MHDWTEGQRDHFEAVKVLNLSKIDVASPAVGVAEAKGKPRTE